MSAQPYSTQGFTRSTYRIDEVDTVVYEIGQGDPLVYFHGGGTFHGFEWARGFADSFRVIVPYHPNFGESGDADFTSMADYMMHYEMLFAAMELERFHLAGASMGGHMAGRYAGEHADEIARLVLISPAGLQSKHASLPDWSAIAPADMRGLFVASLDWLEPFWPQNPSPEWQAMRTRESQAAMRSREDPAASDGAMRAALNGFDAPTLLLWGDHDQVVPPAFAEEWKQVLPHADLAVIPGGSHLLLDEFPQACAAMKAFLLS